MFVHDMEDTHILNAAKMLARNGVDWKTPFLTEIRKRRLSIKPIRAVEVSLQDFLELDEWCSWCGKPDMICNCGS